LWSRNNYGIYEGKTRRGWGIPTTLLPKYLRFGSERKNHSVEDFMWRMNQSTPNVCEIIMPYIMEAENIMTFRPKNLKDPHHFWIPEEPNSAFASASAICVDKEW
jgi:hypothetical protein